jgi:hypothetical protein
MSASAHVPEVVGRVLEDACQAVLRLRLAVEDTPEPEAPRLVARTAELAEEALAELRQAELVVHGAPAPAVALVVAERVLDAADRSLADGLGDWTLARDFAALAHERGGSWPRWLREVEQARTTCVGALFDCRDAFRHAWVQALGLDARCSPERLAPLPFDDEAET